MELTQGKAPPAFMLSGTGGEVSLKELKGRKVVLFFYPKDDTSGCTAEACGFRDALGGFMKAGAVVLGISPDDLKSHGKFRTKHGLPFELLTDAEHAVAEAYGVWKEKSMYGRKFMGVERTTVVIDSAGKIAKVFAKVKVPGHVAEVLAAVEACK